MKYSQREFAKASGVERTKLRRLAAAGKLIPEHDDAGKIFYTAEQIPLARQLAGIDDASQPLFDDEPPAQDVEAVVTTETIPPDDEPATEIADVDAKTIITRDGEDQTVNKSFTVNGTATDVAPDVDNEIAAAGDPAADEAETVDVVPAADDAPAPDVDTENFIAEPLEQKSLKELAEEANLYTARGNDCLKRGLTYYIAAGRRLNEAKSRLKHGQWQNWLAEHFSASADTASNYMNLARHCDESNSETFRNLGFSKAIELLALPAGTEQDFIDEQAAAGRPVERQSAREVKRNVAQFKRDHTADTTETSEEIQGGQIFNVFGKEPPAQDAPPAVEIATTEPPPAGDPAPDTPSPAVVDTTEITARAAAQDVAPETGNLTFAGVLAAARRLIDETTDREALELIRRELLNLADPAALDALRREILNLADNCAAKIERSVNL